MQKLTSVMSALLGSIVQARKSADEVSARLSRDYLENPILKYFPVPRVELADIHLQLKFALAGLEGEEALVIVEADELRELDPARISTADIALKVTSYVWTKGQDDRVLVAVE